MTYLIAILSRFTMIVLVALYVYASFSSLRSNLDESKKKRKYRWQVFYFYLFHCNAYMVLFLSTDNTDILIFYFIQVVFFTFIFLIYGLVYRNAAPLLVNNMCMLLAIGFVMNTRLRFDWAVRQFEMAAVSMVATMLVPVIIAKFRFVRKMTWAYAIIGVASLGIVAVLGAVTGGARISYTVAGITLQPSEFIKIIFVFFVAGMLYESTEFNQVLKATAVAAMHVIILVASTDLGGALIFFVTYLIMLYVATKKYLYLFSGLLAGSVAAVVAYYFFAHVRVRVLAWQDPLGNFALEGNQMSQSLFAIGTGGWFGMGLNQGMPNRIPVVESDFIFAAISEELGGIFAICLTMICISCFLMFFNIAMQMKDRFYKLVALGLGVVYGFQVFLTIGGNIKFIPSTGVTLPLVSYGGSSLLSTLILFAIIQGLYLLRNKEGGSRDEKEKKPRKRQEDELPKIKIYSE